MINPIAPHGPPVQPGVPDRPSPNGKGDDKSFDDFLPDQPSKDVPSLIDDHSPPQQISDDLEPSESDDPAPPILLRPMRWKGGKNVPSDTKTADSTGAVPPVQMPPTPVMLVPSLTMTPHWSLPVPPPQEDNPVGVNVDPVQSTPVNTKLATGPVGSGNGKVPPAPGVPVPTVFPPRFIRTRGEPVTIIKVPVIVQTNPSSEGSNPPVPSGNVAPATGQSVTGHAVPLPTGSDAPTAGTSGASTRELPSFQATATAETVMPTAPVDDRSALEAAMTRRAVPLPVQDDGSTIPANDLPPAELVTMGHIRPLADGNDVPVRPAGSPLPLDAPIQNIAARRTAAMDLRATQKPLAAGGAPSALESSIAGEIIARQQTSETKETISISEQENVLGSVPESSGAGKEEAAKIAGSPMPAIHSARFLDRREQQTTVTEGLKNEAEFRGTPVAKENADVTATLSSNEKEAGIDALLQRGVSGSQGKTAVARKVAGSASVGETVAGFTVGDPKHMDTATPLVQNDSRPEATAARQVVRVETLLQNALSAGESLRPNGNGEMEMRVRLNGGSEDVTVRMQVANDRMQVTFQTDSPALRKALEHGWTQFAAEASRTSSLAMAEPSFVNPAVQSPQTNTSTFDRQDSRRRESASTFADELAPSANVGRRGVSPSTNTTRTSGQAAGRRWSGWA